MRDCNKTPVFEVPFFDEAHGWSVATRHGMVWSIWPDERNNNPLLPHEAKAATIEIIETGSPLFGGWR